MNTSIYSTIIQLILCITPLLFLLYFKQHLTIGNYKNFNKNRDFRYMIHHKESLDAAPQRRDTLQYYENTQQKHISAQRDTNQPQSGKLKRNSSKAYQSRQINVANRRFSLNFFKKGGQCNKNDMKRICNCCNRVNTERDNSITIIKILSDQIQY